MDQSGDVRSHTGGPTHEMEGLLTPGDFESGTRRRWRLAFTPPPTGLVTSTKTDQKVSWGDTGQRDSLGMVQRARQNLRQSLANSGGVSEPVNPITTHGRFSARAGGSECVILREFY